LEVGWDYGGGEESVVEDLNHMIHYKQHTGQLKGVVEERLENLENLDVKVWSEGTP
jgi:hypothetical protein